MTGTLVDEDTLRLIDIEMARGEACERNFRDAPCSGESTAVQSFLYFLVGGIMGGVLVSALTK